jgi:hypothetical protein
MGYKREYLWRVKEGETTAGTGFEPADILCQMYGDPGMRTRVINADELRGMPPWILCSLLNEVYKAGREDAMADLRTVLGIK